MLRRTKAYSVSANIMFPGPSHILYVHLHFQQQLNSSLQEIKHNKIRNLHICVQSGFKPLLCEKRINVSLFSTQKQECQGQTTKVYRQLASQKHFSVYTHSNVLSRWVHFALHIQTYHPGLTLCQTTCKLSANIFLSSGTSFFPE